MEDIHVLRSAEGHVDYIAVIVIHTGTDGFYRVTDDALVSVKTLHRDDGSFRCHSGNVDMIVFLGSDDSGDKSAMTFRIIGAAVVVQVIVSGDHVASNKIRVTGMDAGINDPDRHAFSRQPLIPGCLHTDGLHSPLISEIRVIGCFQKFHRSVFGRDGFHRVEILHTIYSK